MRRRAGALTTSIVAIALMCASCSSGGHSGSTAAAPTTLPQPAATFAVVGTSASVGDGLQLPLQYSWPRLVFREAFPRATVLVNAAVSGSSAANALHDQVPLLSQLHPTDVVIWLGAVEVSQLIPPATFERNLRLVVDGARSTGARVLLADLPAYPKTDVRPYNAVIDRVARADGVTLVPLHAVNVHWLVNEPLFLPNQAGQRAVATAIEASLRRT